jgi:hypothetical protein
MAGFRAICQEGLIAGIIIRRQESCNYRSAVPGGSTTSKLHLKSRIVEAEGSLALIAKQAASMGRQGRVKIWKSDGSKLALQAHLFCLCESNEKGS